MKLILLFLVFFNTAFAAHFDFKNDPLFLKTLVSPIWNDLKYEFKIDSTDFPDEEAVINVAIEKGKIQLGKENTALFKLIPLDQNQVKLQWNLQKFSADFILKVRFIFKKFGVRVIHDENYRIEGKNIENALSHLRLEKKLNSPLKLKIVENKNFKLEEIELTPMHGVGQTLKWIFENILSERKVNQLISEKVNKEIEKWANNSALINEIENKANQELSSIKERHFPLPTLASIVSFDIEQFSISKEKTTLSLKTILRPISEEPHPCAQMLMKNAYHSGSISFEMMETIIEHLTTFPRMTQLGVKAPVLCLGYDDYHDGIPLGHPLKVKVLGKTIDFKAWVKPLTMPDFNYLIPEQNIIVQTHLASIVQRNLYPTLTSGPNPIESKITAQFEMKYIQGLGLALNFNQLNVDDIKGYIKIKWARFIPTFKISLKWVKSLLTQELSKGFARDFSNKIILKEKIPFIQNSYLKLDGYEMKNDGHHFAFTFSKD